MCYNIQLLPGELSFILVKIYRSLSLSVDWHGALYLAEIMVDIPVRL